jgi:hypothetical protein
MIRKKKISLVLALATVLAAGICGVSSVFAAGSLSDTSGHWAEGQILAGINYGYILGYEDNTFKPDNTITRAEFVSLINRAKNYSAMTNIPFRDVPVNEWYFPEVQKAYMANYIQGDSENNFRPNAQITRQEVAVILSRITPGGNTGYDLAAVRDAAAIDAWALPAVKAAYSVGYITGDIEGNFNPLSPLKRGEAVTIVNRVLGISPLQPGADLAAFSISNINVSDIQTNSATLSLTSTRDGSVYWVVLTGDNAVTPTADQILSGRTSDNKSAYGSGSRSGVYANTAITSTVSSLESEQSYKICAVARDATANLSPVAIRTFTTLSAGDTGEEWLGNNFTVSNVANNSITLTVNSTRTGYLYYVVVEDPNQNAKTPTQAYIRNGKDAGNSTAYRNDYFNISAGVTKSVDITGLKAGTRYKIFGCVYESTSTSSLYSTVKGSAFTTTGTNAEWLTTFEIQSNSITATGATLNVRADRAGTFYYVVSESSEYPTTARLNSGQDNNGKGSLYSGNYYRSVIANSTTAVSLTNMTLTTGRTYYVFGALYANSSWSNVIRVSFTAGSGTLATPLTNITYTTGAAVIPINFSNYTGTVSETIPANTDVGIAFTKGSGTTVGITIGGNTLADIGSGYTIPSGWLTSGTNTVKLNVSEPNRTSLTYTITITKS